MGFNNMELQSINSDQYEPEDFPTWYGGARGDMEKSTGLFNELFGKSFAVQKSLAASLEIFWRCCLSKKDDRIRNITQLIEENLNFILSHD